MLKKQKSNNIRELKVVSATGLLCGHFVFDRRCRRWFNITLCDQVKVEVSEELVIHALKSMGLASNDAWKALKKTKNARGRNQLVSMGDFDICSA